MRRWTRASERHAPTGNRGCGRPRPRRDARRRRVRGLGSGGGRGGGVAADGGRRRRGRRRCASPRRARTWRGPTRGLRGGRHRAAARRSRPPGRPGLPRGPRRGRRPRPRPCSAATSCRAGRCSPPSGSSWWSPGSRSRASPGRVRSAWALVGGVGVVLFVAVLVGLAGAGGRQIDESCRGLRGGTGRGAGRPGVGGRPGPAHGGGAAVLRLRRLRAPVPARRRSCPTRGGPSA